MSAPDLSTSTFSPEAVALTLSPRQRIALVDLVAGRQPGIAAVGLEMRGLAVLDRDNDRLELTGFGRQVAECIEVPA